MHDEKKKDRRHAKLLKALRDGATLEEAAGVVGVNSSTVRRWRMADPELAEAVQDVMYGQDDAVEAVTYRNCLDPDPAHNTLRMFWLKCRRRETYQDSVSVQHTGKVQLVWPDDERETGNG